MIAFAVKMCNINLTLHYKAESMALVFALVCELLDSYAWVSQLKCKGFVVVIFSKQCRRNLLVNPVSQPTTGQGLASHDQCLLQLYAKG